MNNFTERTGLGVVMGEELKKSMATYIKYPPRKLQSRAIPARITLSNYERFRREWVRKELETQGVNVPDADRKLIGL